jgi:uncharacterized protein YegL
MTAKKFPCVECGATGRNPHLISCSIGRRRSKKKIVKSQKITRVALVFDRSGSMSRIFRSAIASLNAQLNALKMHAQKHGQQTYVSLYDFGSDVRCVFRDRYIDSIQPITENDIWIDGLTAMMDATHVASSNLSQYTSEKGTSFLVIVITDGMENDSRMSERDFIREIDRLNDTDRWTFTFSGPRGSRRMLKDLGVHSGNIQEWDQTDRGVSDMGRNISSGIGNYMAGRAAGKSSTKQFFQVDMSKVADSDVRNMRDLSSSFKPLKVNNAGPGGSEWTIRDFVEDRMIRNRTFNRQTGGNYQIGYAFYQLTKTETVQPSKNILIRDKSNGTIYGGHEARAVIGMPTNTNVRVKPGNFGNWDIFVNSTSVNRKLVRGTDLLYQVR